MTSVETDQTDAIAFLKRNATCGPSVADDVVQTHGALVFLHKDEALKIKRAVTYDYMDFSRLAQRKQMLGRELELNRDAAPGLYHDVVALTREGDGSLVLGGSGPVVEYVLRMTRFPADAELSAMADRGLIDRQLADGLGCSVAQYHRRAAVSEADGRVLIRAIVDELARVMGEMHDQLGADVVLRFLAGCEREQRRFAGLMESRSQAGFVRRCHGDLHLRNIIIWNGVPTPFDALEFDEQLGTCDVLYDLAFLLMDLAHRDLDAAANTVFNTYLLESGSRDHLTGLSALPLFLAIRAGIRAMVDVQTAAVRDNAADMMKDARAFMDQALAFLVPPRAQLIAIGGLSGSGKTTVARKIAPFIGAFPGAVHLRSDLERKAYFGVGAYDPLPKLAYRAGISDEIYRIMRDKARRALDAGHSVILDAVHATVAEREMAEQVAIDAGCAFQGIWLDAETALRLARVESRGQDASDADGQVALKQAKMKTGRIDWLQIDADLALPRLVEQLQDRLTD